MKKQIVGPSAHLATVRKLARAWDRATRTEENAETYELAVRLATKSQRALDALRAAQNATVLPVANTARNRAKAGLAALATIGRVIARAVTATASLAKARAATAARKVARATRRSMRAALLVVCAIAMSATANVTTTAPKEDTNMSTTKITSIPFLPTHHLTASIKGGSMSTDVMAVAGDDGLTRLFTSDEVAHAAKATEWRATGLVTSTEYKLQRNRKDAAKAELKHLTGKAMYFVVRDGELVSWTADELHAIDAAGGTAAQPTKSADESIIAEMTLTPKKPKRAVAGRQTIPTIKDEPAPKVAPAKTGEKTHRPGSVMGMSVEELQAEFTAKTGLPAPSSSIHYMRKQVLKARNGKKEFKFREAKAPTLAFGLEEARLLAEVLVTTNVSTDTLAPIAAKLYEFIASASKA